MKKVLSLVLAVTMIIGLVGCSVGEDEVEGTYTGYYTWKGDSFGVVIALKNGEYAKATSKNGGSASVETGEYEIKGSKVRLYASEAATSHGSWTEYKYKNGVLVNNGHEFIKG